MSRARTRHRLSKSRFVTGLQCHKLLWWQVHEPEAEELQPDKVLQDLFSQGQHVGQVATEQFPNGRLIDHPHHEYGARVAATREAIDDGAPVVYEASFIADEVFVAVDVLERTEGGFNLIEVKSSTSQKPEHVQDAAIQAHVLAQNAVEVKRAQIMHLNKDHRNPDQGELFARTDVSGDVEEFLPLVPDEITRQLNMLAGPLPEIAIGSHCFEPRACPFTARCWPHVPNHISTLYNVGPKKTCAYMEQGIHTIHDLAPGTKLPTAAQRQLRALAEDHLIVEGTLPKALEPLRGNVSHLDFETVMRAIPVWPGIAPWGAATAQFSYHEEQSDGSFNHDEYLAEGPHDPRPELTQAMLEVTANADKIVVYSGYEKRMIRELQQAVPDLAEPLSELESKLVDLLPIVRNNIYHPDFKGSFSLKAILNPLVPELTYDDLVIVDGRVASVEIARLLFVAHKIPEAERDRVRHDLLEYCKRDTWATVKLLERLRELAGA
jgi:predicted RecB family nuclease